MRTNNHNGRPLLLVRNHVAKPVEFIKSSYTLPEYQGKGPMPQRRKHGK
jgi:hypothetical protein